MTVKSQRVIMVRSSLEDLPAILTPAGFQLRWYGASRPAGTSCPAEGTTALLPAASCFEGAGIEDKNHWLAIHRRAEPRLTIEPELFDRAFGCHADLLPQRQVFLLGPEGVPVGTATAWFDSIFDGRECGRVHWVAVLPEYQRRGLASVLLRAVCERLRELGHDRAYLVTWSDRPWAIRLYKRFGFQVSSGPYPNV